MNRGITCTLTRPLSARIADANSFSPPEIRSSTLRRASPTSPRDAVTAATPARLSAVRALLPLARCSTPFAATAVSPARFPSSPTMTVPFTATTASATETTDLCKHRSVRHAKTPPFHGRCFRFFQGKRGSRTACTVSDKLKCNLRRFEIFLAV